ncbi:NAD(P)H-dependent glycerol-3-phosphate dehydrogenase [Pedosphaera parvula]|uniref:Glycerol-3-phosphate dehydrogenase [NAD(P)+] n=1 Tax=Pedosphaera parvula (strain Ellin514) TaxID=320771 RepID=B9XR52_PEDPL|nr:NAD(P)H-dependent glycerol-3-phosphate dehydrogenase [Pedosphaera parvula]EEF57665.1 Glycerol-3-phosphate dehydrogenase (NAD(P)(+)) [Pedosphaera parvula Ellin514]
MKVTVLGAGAWGTALAKVLAEGGHAITLWGHDAKRLEEVKRSGRNERYLPGVELPKGWQFESDVARAVQGSEFVVAAVPSKAFRHVTSRMPDYAGVVVSVTKGIEYESGLTMCGILAETAPKAKAAAVSGPTFALEVAKGIPTACVVASRDPGVVGASQNLLHQPTFRVYTSLDILGVELGGSLKNVIAVAAGVCDGLGFGDSSKAALITRAMAEIRRLGVSCGAQGDTFAGLSGLGDLTVTCFSRLSRNRGFGERLGKGEKLEDVLGSMVAVAEGYPTARSAYQLARKHNVMTPVIDEVYQMLYEGKNVRQGVRDLLARDSKPED